VGGLIFFVLIIIIIIIIFLKFFIVLLASQKGQFWNFMLALERGSKWFNWDSFHTRPNLIELVVVHGCCFL
jgi:hypothetical protein